MTAIKWDGHTHTQLCPHGPADDTSLMIEKAIKLGFTRYTIAEHAPLPVGLIEDQALWAELALKEDQVETYFTLIADLKKDYGSKIEILAGMEFDYLAGYEDYSRNLLQEIGPRLDDSLLSMHFIPIANKLQMIDFSPEHCREKVVKPLGSVTAMHHLYWESILPMLHADLGPYKPKRISHIGLIYKFIQELPLDHSSEYVSSKGLYLQICAVLKAQGLSLDYNMAGLSYKHCRMPYFPPEFAKLAKKAEIPLVYGSDAHGIAQIGHHYEQFEQ